ncbi:MFS transporter [Candidatus Bathyarchaeota archaeon]|nr:MFS transporter [Candidatus Bathyarchaeota archaeon]
MDEVEEAPHVYLIILSGHLAVLGSLGFARFGYSMILPSMKEGLELSYTQMGLMASGNFSGYMVFAILGGLLASKYGARIVMIISLTLVGASMFLTGLAENFLQALILRCLAGVGSGGANISAMTLPASWVSTRRRGSASGLIASGSGVGLLGTGIIVPRLNEMFGGWGWRLSWMLLGASTLIFVLICSLIMGGKPGFSRRDGTSGWREVGADTVLWRVGLIYLMFGLSYVIYITFFGAYLVKEVGLAEQYAGELWALVGSLSLFSGPLWGHISDKIGRGYTLSLIYFIQSISLLLFAQGWSEEFIISAILFGMTAWSIPTVVAAYSGDYFGSKMAPSALGFLTLFFGVGQSIGPTVAGHIADVTGTFKSTFLLSSSIAAIGGIMSLLAMRRNRV